MRFGVAQCSESGLIAQNFTVLRANCLSCHPKVVPLGEERQSTNGLLSVGSPVVLSADHCRPVQRVFADLNTGRYLAHRATAIFVTPPKDSLPCTTRPSRSCRYGPHVYKLSTPTFRRTLVPDTMIVAIERNGQYQQGTGVGPPVGPPRLAKCRLSNSHSGLLLR